MNLTDFLHPLVVAVLCLLQSAHYAVGQSRHIFPRTPQSTHRDCSTGTCTRPLRDLPDRAPSHPNSRPDDQQPQNAPATVDHDVTTQSSTQSTYPHAATCNGTPDESQIAPRARRLRLDSSSWQQRRRAPAAATHHTVHSGRRCTAPTNRPNELSDKRTPDSIRPPQSCRRRRDAQSATGRPLNFDQHQT